MDEFELINRYFRPEEPGGHITVGIGDDGAVIRARVDHEQVVVTDSLVAGVHFSNGVMGRDLGHKAMAVNLSDLAAMGAEPDWGTLNLILPIAEPEWLEGFAEGFFELANRYGVTLIGGDTSRGPLAVTVTAGGWVPTGQALCRAGARNGHLVYVSGTLGDAALALELYNELGFPSGLDQERLAGELHRPEPRIPLGLALRAIASAAIDLSDGLASGLHQMVSASGHLGAVIEIERLPLSREALGFRTRQQVAELALVGGDDYELCFSVLPKYSEEIAIIAKRLGLPLTMIGWVDNTPGVRVVSQTGDWEEYSGKGHRHVW